MKTIRKQYKDKKLVAFKNSFVTYGRTFDKTYSIELKVIKSVYFTIYKSKRKPIFRNINIILFLWMILLIPIRLLLPLFYFVWNYIDGGINYFNNGVWANNVRFFNNVNIFIIIILTIVCLWT